MDLGELPPQLEGIADKIHVPGFDIHAMIAQMWDIYHKSVMNIPAAEPVRDLGRHLQAHAGRLDTMMVRLADKLNQVGPDSDQERQAHLEGEVGLHLLA